MNALLAMVFLAAMPQPLLTAEPPLPPAPGPDPMPPTWSTSLTAPHMPPALPPDPGPPSAWFAVTVNRVVRPQPPRYVPASTVLTYWVDGLPGRSLDRAWDLSRKAAARWSAVADLDLLPSRSRAEAAIVVKPRPMFWGYAGLTDMGHPDHYRRGVTGVELGINPHFRGGDEYLTRILTHEFGHALGLSHNTSGIMNGYGGIGPETELNRDNVMAAASLYGHRRRNQE